MMNLAGAVLRHREAAAPAEMIVMSADDDILGRERRVAAPQRTDDVSNGTPYACRAIDRADGQVIEHARFGGQITIDLAGCGLEIQASTERTLHQVPRK